MSRSNWAKALKIVKINCPVGVLSISPMFRILTLMLRLNRIWMISRASLVLRAKRSNFVTINVSFAFSSFSNLLNSGRSVVVPVNFS